MIGISAKMRPPLMPPSARGFAWWYADIVGEPGEAVVLLWARRLPFIPPRAGGDAPLAVALAVYRDGREHFYALQTAGEQAARSTDSELRIGNSRFRVDERGGHVSLRADLDLVLPASGRVRGVVEIDGARARLATGEARCLDWLPVTAMAAGRAALEWQGGSCELSGRGYFDGNAGDAPLTELGIVDWRWGRIAMPSREVVYFQLSSEGGAAQPVVLTVAADGEAHLQAGATVDFADAAPGWFGLRRGASVMVKTPADAISISLDDRVEDGFFYQRYLVSARSESGEVGNGVAERVVPGRLAAAWHRPLVRMRIDHHDVPPSRWFPLFSGAREGRWARLVASWRGAPPVPT
jgi:carotenoid 1,2-hydratase